MSRAPETIPVLQLALATVPAAVLISVLYRWSIKGGTALYASVRMVVQLILIGYVLAYVFTKGGTGLVGLLLCFMLGAASWIALRPFSGSSPKLFLRVMLAVAGGCLPSLAVISLGVLRLENPLEPTVIVPLAGMLFANAMNSVSIGGERFFSECAKGAEPVAARNTGMQAALIPLINSMLAVGLVSLPGMMTGQILAGTSPLVAVRYQIMVMFTIFASSGLAAAIFLQRSEKAFRNQNPGA